MVHLLPLFIATILLASLQGVQSATYYISSSRGNNRNPATLAQPWATISRAYQLTQFTYPTIQPGHTVLLCRGDSFYLTYLVGITSFSPDDPFTFGSYKCGDSDELPIVTPSIWLAPRQYSISQSDPRMLVANVAMDSASTRYGLEAVWVEEERRLPARSPNLRDPRDATIQSTDEFYVPSSSTIANGRIYCANLTQDNDYWTNATVFMRINNWTYQQSRILSSGPGWIQTESWPTSGLVGGFYIENTYDRDTIRMTNSQLLQVDAPGEWSFDGGNMIYYPVDDAERTAILAGTKRVFVLYREYGLIGTANANLLFSNANTATWLWGTGYIFQDIHFKWGGGGIINYGSTWFRAYRNKISHMSGFGIRSDRAAGMDLTDNIVDDADADCIWFSSAGGVIQNNRVSRCGMIAGYGFLKGGTNKGISAYYANVIGNTVSYTGYAGIEPHYGSNVQFNDISNVLLTLNDGGGIYGYGSAASGVLIEGNRIDNVVGNWLSWTPNAISSCIMTDEGTSLITVYNNTCSETPQCMQMNKASGNVVLSNKCNSPGIYMNNGAEGGNHVVVGNSITTFGTSSILQNPISRVNAPGATSLSSGVAAFYNNIYCQQQSNGNYLWQTDFGVNGVYRYYTYNDWVYSECRGNPNCYFEQNSGFYYGNCDSRQPFFFTNGINGRPIYVEDSKSSFNPAVVIGVVVPVVVVLALAIGAIMYKRSKSRQSTNPSSVEQTISSLPNGMLPTVAPLQIRTSSTSSVDYEQFSSPTNQSYTPSFLSPKNQFINQSSNQSLSPAAVEMSPQYILRSSSAPMPAH